MFASEVVRGVAMPTGGLRNGAVVEEGIIPNGELEPKPKGVFGRGDGVFNTYGADRFELRRFLGVFFSGDLRSERSWTTSLSSLIGISSKLLSTCRRKRSVNNAAARVNNKHVRVNTHRARGDDRPQKPVCVLEPRDARPVRMRAGLSRRANLLQLHTVRRADIFYLILQFLDRNVD